MATLSGTVKSFNVHKGWGFVECNGTEYFLHKKELKGMVVEKGTQVQFIAKQSDKGLSAENVAVHCSDPTQAWYFGEIKSFNPNKGFGFITSEAFEGKDIFVLKTDLPGGYASAGAACKMKTESQEKGLIAKEVQLLGQPTGGQYNQYDPMQMMPMMQGMMSQWSSGKDQWSSGKGQWSSGKGMSMGGMGQGMGMGGMGKGMGVGGKGKSMGMGGMGKGMGGGSGGGTGVWQPMFMKQTHNDKGKGKSKGQFKGKPAW